MFKYFLSASLDIHTITILQLLRHLSSLKRAWPENYCLPTTTEFEVVTLATVHPMNSDESLVCE